MDRIALLREQLRGEGIDAMCVRDTSNIAYLTRFEGVFDEERAHALLVGCESCVLHTDSRYAAACRAAAAGGQGKAPRSDDSPDASEQPSAWRGIDIDDEAKTHSEWLAARFAQGALGIEDTISLAEYRKLQAAFEGVSVELRETDGVVLRMREVKDDVELACLRSAQAVTDSAFEHIVGFIRPGLTERQVQRELDDYMLSHGASNLAFPSIVATGPNGANPHAQPTDAPLEAGQCVVMDFGARAQGYCSDMTRMVFLGQPDARLARAYEVLREANETVCAMLAPGVTGAEAHQRALDVLEAGGFGGLMGHGLGHGVGMDVHEQPVLSPRNKEPLVAGNVVTVEPGIYIEGEFGMRLEDCGIVAEGGFEPFGRLGHDMVVL